MSEALLSFACMGMWHFTGQVPPTLSNMAQSKLPNVEYGINKYVNKELKIVAGNTAFVVNSVIEQRIIVRFSF